jgi:DNA invertase Pin-like site-specific DNA recombinase
MKTLKQRFWQKVVIISEDGCWEWTGSRNKDGYGQIWVNGKNKRTNRVAWELHFGEIPEGLCVCHHCDNPACVRPDHLFLGTQKDNAQDMVKKGRSAFGEKMGNSKLNETQVKEIRELYNSGLFTYKELGNKFGISISNIRDITNKKIWSQVNSPPLKFKRNGNSRLNETQVKEIRRLYNTGLYTRKELGNKFGVDRSNIGFIVNKKSWSHIESPALEFKRNGNSKLNETQVKEIRRLYATGLYTQKELGNKFNLSQTNIGYIVNNKYWSHI